MKIFWAISATINAAAVLLAGSFSPEWDWQSHLNLIFAFGSAYAAGAAK